jgi:hypothetical protein
MAFLPQKTMSKKLVSKAKNSMAEKKAVAETMFVEDGMIGKAISETLDVSEVTISKWRTEGNWDTKREELLAAPHELRKILIRELKKIAEGRKSFIDADALAKVSKVLESISDRISIQIIISVFKEFDNFMADDDPKTAVLFTDYHKKFILHKINQEG